MRIVIKIGTSTITHPTGRLNIRQMEALCKVLSDLKNAGNEVILVSSGAIGMGVGKLRLGKKPVDVPTKQASAAVGQCELMYIYDKLFTEYNHTVAQLLITAPDIEEGGVRKQNFHNTLARLLELGALPVINENDTISTEEFGMLREAAIDIVNELGVEGFRACDYTNMWYNGPYVVEEFISQNTKSYIPNPNYYDAANVSRFERFTVTMISDGAISLQLYQNRELDEVDLGESSITTIQSDPSNEYNQQLCEKRAKKFSYCFIFNYDKMNTDGTPDENWNKAIANKAFRQCFSKGMVLNKFFARYNPINPLKCENDFFTMKGLCYTSDGTDYTNLVAKEMGLDGEAYDGKTMKRLRANNGDITELKKQAMEELSAIGVTFPVHCSYYILAGSTSALDHATVLKQCFTDSFGDDFIVLDIKTFVSSLTQEVRNPQLQSFVINGWGADFGDPVNFLGQEILHDDNAYYAHYYSNIARVAEAPADYQKDLMDAFEQYTDLVNAASAIVNDTDARYEAFAKAEAYMLENVLVSPTYYDVAWSLTHANEYSKINAVYGPCNYKAVNWETSEEAYTTEQYEEFAAAFDAATKA